MKFHWDNRYLRWGVTAFFVIAASMLFYYGIFHMSTLIAGIKSFLHIMAPIIYGIILAYILSPLINFFEKKIIFPILEKRNIQLQKKGKRVIRWICVILSMVIFWVIIYTLIMLILPQLIRSIMSVIYSFPYYVKVVEKWLNSFVEHGFNLNSQTISLLNQFSSKIQEYLTNNILPQMQDMLRNISNGIFDILIFMKNFLIGAIVSLYVLADKEKFVAKSKMIVYAVLPSKWAKTLIHAMRFTDKTFGGFIYGKLLDSAIMGVLCYVGMLILKMPYAVLVSVIIGVTNIIPFFGPYVGAIPSIILILLVNPIKGLYFLIFIILLQQFDGNILGPKILGDSTGLSSFMVIVAIMVGGGLFGVPGMIIGVPAFAVLYAMVWRLINHSLKNKKMPEKEEQYINIDCLDEKTKETIPMPEPKPDPEKAQQKIKRNTFFMKVWNTLYGLVMVIWKYVKIVLMYIWKYLKTGLKYIYIYIKAICIKINEKIKEGKNK
ncbi:MAG: AI-2E family transporter [Clostridia bacterium]|nr:AI-2E family transporter [Clostridia bacterium]MDY5554419.1 AI-2E family transporter [Blautia sp.]